MTVRMDPGVRLAEHTLMLPPAALATAVPVFIGLVSGAKARPFVGRLYALQSLEDWPKGDGIYQTGQLYDTVRHYFDNGGGPCHVLDAGWRMDLLPDWIEDLGKASFYAAVLQEPAITLVALPTLGVIIDVRVQSTAGDSDRSRQIADWHLKAWRGLLDAFSSRPDLFFLLDAPRTPESAEACIKALREQGGLGERGQFAALYGPHLVTDYPTDVSKDNPLGLTVVPPCGAVASVVALTDQGHGLWKAPANEALLHVVQPEYRETVAGTWFDSAKPGINLIRSFAGRGVRVWGCRTLSTGPEPAMRYVQSRRLLSWIEANLATIGRRVVFEPNNELTWFKLKGLTSAWLRRLWHRGGLAGAQEEQAFEVLVGRGESMSAEDIEAGRLIVTARVALLRAAEFIEVNLVLNQSGSELVSSPQPNASVF